jgi:hypothetical protein
MNLLCTLICLCLLTLTSFDTQTTSYKANGWHDLVLDQSTSEETVRVLGQPVNDKIDRLYIHNVDQWVTPTHKEKIFRVLTYKRIGEVNKAELDFLDNKLVRVFLEYDEKKFSAKDFGARIGLDFVMVEGEVPSDSTPSMYEGQKEALVPKVYPAVYYMVCVSPQSLVSANVLSGRGKAVFKEAFRVKTKEPFPGSVIHVEMISRSFAKG